MKKLLLLTALLSSAYAQAATLKVVEPNGDDTEFNLVLDKQQTVYTVTDTQGNKAYVHMRIKKERDASCVVVFQTEVRRSDKTNRKSREITAEISWNVATPVAFDIVPGSVILYLTLNK